MSSVPLQVQFDPSSARFGASRSQKRLEDDRLLAGKGRYSDDLEFPNQCWLVVVRSPGPKSGHVWSDGDGSASFSYPVYKALRDKNNVFAGLLA